jgi:hypothetical protein
MQYGSGRRNLAGQLEALLCGEHGDAERVLQTLFT